MAVLCQFSETKNAYFRPGACRKKIDCHGLEEGTYDVLIAQNGHFAELVARQRLDAAG